MILHIDNILPYLINAAMDGAMLIALTVVAIIVGRPLSYLDCKVIGSSSVSESTYQLGAELKNNVHNQGGVIVYSNWIGANKTTCYEMKAIWGLSIALWYAGEALHKSVKVKGLIDALIVSCSASRACVASASGVAAR